MRAVLAVALLPLSVLAQSLSPSFTASVGWSTFAVGGGIAAVPYTTSVPVTPATQTQCWVYETLQDGVASVPLPASASVPSNAVCWQIYSTGGGTMRVPMTPALASIPTEIPTASTTSSGNQSSSNRVKIIVPVVLAPIAGIALIAAVSVYLIRRKNRRDATEKRAWVDRPGGWVPDVEQSHVAGPISITLAKAHPQKSS